MKRKPNHFIFPVLLCALLGCGEKDQGPGGSGPGGKVEPGELTLTPFEHLNQGTSAVNSHAGMTSHSSLMMNFRSYTEIGPGQLNVDTPVYPRVKKMANGEYILFYHNNQIGADIYYVRSADMVTWTGGERLFARHSITDSSGAANERRFATCNAVVLANGDILAVASYRANTNFRQRPLDNGLIMRRSSDNGQTWSSAVEIYRGTNWEPHLMQLPSGEVHCYFTNSTNVGDAPHTYDSGTSLIVSTDDGASWTPSFGNPPYKVIRLKYGETNAGVGLFTDQMPGVIKLNNSKQLVAALESHNPSSANYYLSLAYSDTNGEWVHLADNEQGPADRNNYIYLGAAPSLAQFASGETVLSYNQSSLFTLRLGDEGARNFGEAYVPFTNKGYWGTLEVIDGHRIIGSMHTSGALMMAGFMLNHGIRASRRTVAVDGDNREWLTTDEALFVGGKSQAQGTLRCASDDQNIYFLIEVLDAAISADDYAVVYLSPETENNTVGSQARRIRVSYNGVKSTDHYAGGWKETAMDVSARGAYDTSGDSETDGYLIEVAVPKSQLGISSGKLLVNFSIFDTVGGEDAIYSTASKSMSGWLPISGL